MPTSQGFRLKSSVTCMMLLTTSSAPITVHRIPNKSHCIPARISIFLPNRCPISSSCILASSRPSSSSSGLPFFSMSSRFITYGTNRIISAIPSRNDSAPSNRSTEATMVTVIRNTASRMIISLVTLSGTMIAVSPMTKAMVTTFEAMPLPSAIISAPSFSATMDTSTSGIAAKVDTTSIPMTNLLIPKLRETATALSVMNFAPWFSTMNPRAIIGMNISEAESKFSHPEASPLSTTWHTPIYGFSNDAGTKSS